MKSLFSVKSTTDEKEVYTTVVNIPQYAPKNNKPALEELCDYSKYSKLKFDIDKSNVSEEEKKFLKIRMEAIRFVFGYYLRIRNCF